jgi:hypothetical protein
MQRSLLGEQGLSWKTKGSLLSETSLSFSLLANFRYTMVISISYTPTWKGHFLKMAKNPNQSGSNLSSIHNTSLSFSTQEMIRFLELDPSLSLLINDDGASLLLLHHFNSFSSLCPKQESTLAAVARTEWLPQ